MRLTVVMAIAAVAVFNLVAADLDGTWKGSMSTQAGDSQVMIPSKPGSALAGKVRAGDYEADISSQVIDPGASENLRQGAVIDGMSEMLLEISLKNGRVVQPSYHQHALLRMSQAPEIEVHFLKSDFPPTGLGEPALPPILPAISNAVFAITGERVRTMPMTKQGFNFV